MSSSDFAKASNLTDRLSLVGWMGVMVQWTRSRLDREPTRGEPITIPRATASRTHYTDKFVINSAFWAFAVDLLVERQPGE